MGEGQGKKNRGFLKKFVSKKVLRERLQEQRNAKIEERKEWSKKVVREEKKKKDRWKSSSTIPNPQDFHKYQEIKHGTPVKLSKTEKDKIKKNSLVETPLIKKSIGKNKK